MTAIGEETHERFGPAGCWSAPNRPGHNAAWGRRNAGMAGSGPGGNHSAIDARAGAVVFPFVGNPIFVLGALPGLLV